MYDAVWDAFVVERDLVAGETPFPVKRPISLAEHSLITLGELYSGIGHKTCCLNTVRIIGIQTIVEQFPTKATPNRTPPPHTPPFHRKPGVSLPS